MNEIMIILTTAGISYLIYHLNRIDDKEKPAYLLKHGVLSLITAIVATVTIINKFQFLFQGWFVIVLAIMLIIKNLQLYLIGILILLKSLVRFIEVYAVVVKTSNEAVDLIVRNGYPLAEKNCCLIEWNGVCYWLIDDTYLVSLSGYIYTDDEIECDVIEVGEEVEIHYITYELRKTREGLSLEEIN
ncbi:MAG: hypothetical protein LBR70_01235 [Lactobacillaceae bacterium]|jgi:hypothetical protein|nr:hypothetical protein [Lactobacillaceae bacterium]